MFDIAARSGIEIIDAKDFVALGEKALAEMRSDKSGAPGDQSAFRAGIGSPIEH
jgi:hypothetical protein